MADYNEIPDSALIVGKPVRSIDALALRDNPIAIAEGALGAPRILDIAFANVSAGDIPILFNATTRTTTSQTSVKVKESMAARGGEYRIAFSLGATGGGIATAQLYINGVAVGAVRSNSSGTHIVYTEDISGISEGDLVQVYAFATNIQASVRDLTLYADTPVVPIAIL